MRIENYDYRNLIIGDFVMYKETHRVSVGIVKATKKEHWSDDDYCVRARDIKILNWNPITSNPVLVKDHLINRYTITYFGQITEEEFFEQYPEYNI